MSFNFDFAISFAKDTRPIAETLSKLLSDRDATAFYDEEFQAFLLGKRLDKELPSIYCGETRYFVPIVSKEYAQRTWPQLEWNAALKEQDLRQEEFILPLRFDDTILWGLPGSVSYLDLRELSLTNIADLLVEKLKGSTGADGRNVLHTWVATLAMEMAPWDVELLPEEGTPEYEAALDGYLTMSTEVFQSNGVGRMRVLEENKKLDSLRVRIAFEWDPRQGALELCQWSNWEIKELIPYDKALSPD